MMHNEELHKLLLSSSHVPILLSNQGGDIGGPFNMNGADESYMQNNLRILKTRAILGANGEMEISQQNGA
jgi:hypothetical protein